MIRSSISYRTHAGATEFVTSLHSEKFLKTIALTSNAHFYWILTGIRDSETSSVIYFHSILGSFKRRLLVGSYAELHISKQIAGCGNVVKHTYNWLTSPGFFAFNEPMDIYILHYQLVSVQKSTRLNHYHMEMALAFVLTRRKRCQKDNFFEAGRSEQRFIQTVRVRIVLGFIVISWLSSGRLLSTRLDSSESRYSEARKVFRMMRLITLWSSRGVNLCVQQILRTSQIYIYQLIEALLSISVFTITLQRRSRASPPIQIWHVTSTIESVEKMCMDETYGESKDLQ